MDYYHCPVCEYVGHLSVCPICEIGLAPIPAREIDPSIFDYVS